MNKQEYVAKVLGKCEEGTILLNEYINAKTKLVLQCPKGHIREATSNGIISKNTGTKCYACQGKTSTGKRTDESVAEEFSNYGFVKLAPYEGALTKVLVERKACGHQFLLSPDRVFKKANIICPECSGKRVNYGHPEFTVEIGSMGLVPIGTYVDMHTAILVKNNTCQHEYSVTPGHLLYTGTGKVCPICTGATATKTRFFSKLLENNLECIGQYTTTQEKVLVLNKACGHTYEVIPNNLVCADTGLVCRTCSPVSRVSREELSLVEYIQSIYEGWVELSDRAILKGKELDIVLPELGIAIEYNGTYWHSEDRCATNYHLDKTNMVESYGYQLIHITDSEWKYKPEIVKSRLKNLLGKTEHKVYARDTNLVALSSFPAEFLNKNHLQGAGAITKHNYGLMYKDELIAVMTFSKPRFNLDHDFELVRFATKVNTNVIGGASKLLRAFTKEYPGSSVVSYSDRRWSTGKLYQSLGFSLVHNSVPNYKYYKYKEVLSRYQCTKQLLKTRFPELWKPELSETEIMKLAGYYKVYDCGSGVWSLRPGNNRIQ